MKKLFLILIPLLLFVACQKKEMPLIEQEVPFIPFAKGTGVVTYTDYAPLSEKAIKIWYYNPVESPKDLPIVMVFHGAGRNGKDYRDNWIALADQYQLLIIAPEFSSKDFSGSANYNLGNLFNDNGDAVPENEWTFSVVEPIFDYIVEAIEGNQSSYDIFGHSAGSQFVHRWMLFKEEIRADRLIAANAGWYTMLNETIPFPYGLQDTPSDEADVRRVLQKEVIVLLGDADTLRTNNLRTTPEADLQGQNRLERGQSYFAVAKAKATELGVPFNWKMRFVPDVGHDNGGMANFIAEVLYEK